MNISASTSILEEGVRIANGSERVIVNKRYKKKISIFFDDATRSILTPIERRGRVSSVIEDHFARLFNYHMENRYLTGTGESRPLGILSP